MRHRIRKWTTDEAGCLIGGQHGWNGHAYMIDLAVESGWPISEDDTKYLDRYRKGPQTETDPDWRMTYGEAGGRMLNQGGLMGRAEEWMNEHCAPEGYSFGWYEGEFFLAHERWWGQDVEVGYDRDRQGDPIVVDIHGV